MLLQFEHPQTSVHINLDFREEHRSVCTRIINSIKSGDGPTCSSNLQYHRGCYSKFTNVGHIKRAQNRINKMESTNYPEGDLIEPAPEELPVSPKLLRSNTSVNVHPVREIKRFCLLFASSANRKSHASPIR